MGVTRLAEPEGPEVVLISTGASPSWFDQLTMDRARSRVLAKLRAADRFGRFRAYCPVTPEGRRIVVHSKCAVIDDRLARVGSANLNNRSGGFDTELELAIEARTPQARAGLDAYLDQAVGHFLGCAWEAVAAARLAHGGLIGAIEALNGAGLLRPIEPLALTPFGEMVAAYHLGDPVGVVDSWHPGRRPAQLDLARRLDQLTPPQNP